MSEDSWDQAVSVVRVVLWVTKRVGATFVFEKVAHARAASEDELGDVFDDLGLVSRRQRREPFGQALWMCVSGERFAKQYESRS